MGTLGVVAIGRNEGERLRKCLTALLPQLPAVVYVDSGSTDGSMALAASLGVTTVDLDLSIPFTAARARNAGFERLVQDHPDTVFVQFIDGDCEILPGWLERARAELEAQPNLAVVCGRRRERFPDASIYNRLCDIEWDTPVGEAKACGGDALMRVEAVRQVDGYDASVLAAEDDDLCLRMRLRGWRVLRIDADMTLHDAAMSRAGQWWKRAVRCGYAYAQGASRFGKTAGHFVPQRRSIWVWGLLLPLVALAAAWPTGGWSLLIGLLYPLQTARIYFRSRRQLPPRIAAAWALSCTLSKFPQLVGVCKFLLQRVRQTPIRLIEYK